MTTLIKIEKATTNARAVAVAILAALMLLGGAAEAQDKAEGKDQAEKPRRARNPLDGQPAVRKRKLLVSGRFEVTPTFMTSINADYKHTVGGGLKLEYHLNDSLSFGAFGSLGTSFNTGLSSRISDSLSTMQPDAGDPTPSRAEFEEHLNDIPLSGAAYVSWTPSYGKLAAFGKAFVPFDFYLQGGLAFASLSDNCDATCTDMNPEGTDAIPPDRDPNNDPSLNGGTRLGLYLGVGMHVWLTDYLALDLSFRDLIFANNPSGLDFDADLAVTDEDERTLNHFFAGIGVSIMFPLKAERTE